MEWQHKRHEQGQIGHEQGIRVDSLLKLDVQFDNLYIFLFLLLKQPIFWRSMYFLTLLMSFSHVLVIALSTEVFFWCHSIWSGNEVVMENEHLISIVNLFRFPAHVFTHG